MNPERVKFLVVGDLHGNMPKIHSEDFDAIICPGDICGDDMRKYIDEIIMMRSELGENIEIDMDEFCSEKERNKLEKLSIKKGREVLKKLNSFGKPVFLVPGNWDHTPYEDGVFEDFEKISKAEENIWKNEILRGFENIVDVEYKKKSFKGITIIGHGSTSGPEPIEQHPPEAFDSEEEFIKYVMRYNFFAKVFMKLSNYMQKETKPVILISHNVPHNTKLDLVDKPSSYAHRKHYGSITARLLIDNFSPLLCVGGHIHEGYGKQKIKNTMCINAGFGGDVNTLIEINPKENKILKIDFLGKNKSNH